MIRRRRSLFDCLTLKSHSRRNYKSIYVVWLLWRHSQLCQSENVWSISLEFIIPKNEISFVMQSSHKLRAQYMRSNIILFTILKTSIIYGCKALLSVLIRGAFHSLSLYSKILKNKLSTSSSVNFELIEFYEAISYYNFCIVKKITVTETLSNH